jgi:hypothetical protein
MRLRVLKIAQYRSKRNPNYLFSYVFFKSLEDGKSYKTCISEEFRNYRWWKDIEIGDIIEINDKMIRGNLIDADAIPSIVSKGGII